MNKLPMEIVIQILDFLPSLSDRQAASQINQLWYNAYQHSKFRKQEIIVLTCESHIKSITNLPNTNRRYLNFVLKECDLNSKISYFWDKFGSDMKILSIFNCEITEKTFIDIITKCDHLQELIIVNCRDLFIGKFLILEENKILLRKSLIKLKKLNLSWNRYLTDAIFISFMLITGNLEYLTLSGCPISFHPGLYKRFYPRTLSTFEPSESVLTFHVILQGISVKAKTLKILNFSETLIDSRAVGLLVQVEGLELSALMLRSCQQLSKEGISKVCQFQKQITELDVSMCPRITDTSLKDICTNLINLKILSVQKCKAITDLGVAEINKLTNLKKLNISECDSIMGSGLVTALGQKQNNNLIELQIASLANISGETIIKICQCLPNLTYLDVSYCVNAVTDDTIQHVILNNRRLVSLICTMCNNISDSGLTGVPSPSEMTTLHPFKVHLGSRAEQEIVKDARLKESIKVLSESDKTLLDCLKNLKNIEELFFSGCIRITDTSLKHAIKFLSLRYLDLSNCTQITHVGIMHLTKNNPSIETLNLDFCANINDSGVEAVVKNLKRLKTLILGSPKITDSSIVLISDYCATLRYLDIRHCSNISSDSPYVTLLLGTVQTFHFNAS